METIYYVIGGALLLLLLSGKKEVPIPKKKGKKEKVVLPPITNAIPYIAGTPIPFGKHPLVTRAFLVALAAMANRNKLGVPELMVTIYHESGFNHKAISTIITKSGKKKRGCPGLIQWCNPPEIDTTKDEILKLSQIEQIPLIEKYFKLPRIAKNLPEWADLYDTYLAVFAPNLVGKPDSKVAYSKFDEDTKSAYESNVNADKNKDGVIDRGDVKGRILSSLRTGLGSDYFGLPDK